MRINLETDPRIRLWLWTRQSAQEGRRLGKTLRNLDWHSAGLRSRSTR